MPIVALRMTPAPKIDTFQHIDTIGPITEPASSVRDQLGSVLGSGPRGTDGARGIWRYSADLTPACRSGATHGLSVSLRWTHSTGQYHIHIDSLTTLFIQKLDGLCRCHHDETRLRHHR